MVHLLICMLKQRNPNSYSLKNTEFIFTDYSQFINCFITLAEKQQYSKQTMGALFVLNRTYHWRIKPYVRYEWWRDAWFLMKWKFLPMLEKWCRINNVYAFWHMLYDVNYVYILCMFFFRSFKFRFKAELIHAHHSSL